MIAVVADDLTGAAELSGIGLRYGLSVEVQLNISTVPAVDLIIIDTATRSMSGGTALETIRKTVLQLKEMNPEWVYKKTDSVMRGHVLAELQTLLTGLNKRSVLFVPANPSLGRTIAGGKYYIDNALLHETSFADDPEYDLASPLPTSNVMDLLGSSPGVDTCYIKHPETVPEHSIAVGETVSRKDLLAWAARLDEQMIPAGGRDFFDALMESKGFLKQPLAVTSSGPPDTKTLFVCGSGSQRSNFFLTQLNHRGIPVCDMPCSLGSLDKLTAGCLQQWSSDTLRALKNNSRVIMAIRQPISRSPGVANKLTEFVAAVVEAVFQKMTIEELFIEGGSTASAILRRLNWKRLIPFQEIAPGVVRMRVLGRPQQYLTVKPGSYAWPGEVWAVSDQEKQETNSEY